jgi:hypothetical protein
VPTGAFDTLAGHPSIHCWCRFQTVRDLDSDLYDTASNKWIYWSQYIPKLVLTTCIPEVRRRRTNPDYRRPVILILNECPAHDDDTFWDQCTQENISRLPIKSRCVIYWSLASQSAWSHDRIEHLRAISSPWTLWNSCLPFTLGVTQSMWLGHPEPHAL